MIGVGRQKPVALMAKSAAALLASALVANALPVAQEWYVPQPEDQLRQDYSVLATGLSTIADTVIAITVPVPGTQIVVDHWEDGYETPKTWPKLFSAPVA